LPLEAAENHMTMAGVTSPAFTEAKTWFSADIAPGSSDTLVGGSQRKRDFFFELNAELIVYGRTEPGAHVIMGDEIELREDGTFTQRLALPEGVLPLDFCARSSDGSEQKFISLQVDKATIVYP